MCGDDGKTAGVCIEHVRVAPIVDALEARGWSISAVCPAGLLALSQWVTRSTHADVNAVLVTEGDEVEAMMGRTLPPLPGPGGRAYRCPVVMEEREEDPRP